MTNLQDSIHRRLLDFRVDTSDPRWSSHILNELISSVVSTGGGVGDILQCVFPLLAQTHLSLELANFIRDLTRYVFSKYQESYRASNLQWMQDAVSHGCTAPQGYLAMYSLPLDLLNAKCTVSIFKALAGTPFWSEAIANLGDEAKSTQVRDLLKEWLLSGIEPPYRSDVERLAKIRTTT